MFVSDVPSTLRLSVLLGWHRQPRRAVVNNRRQHHEETPFTLGTFGCRGSGPGHCILECALWYTVELGQPCCTGAWVQRCWRARDQHILANAADDRALVKNPPTRRFGADVPPALNVEVRVHLSVSVGVACFVPGQMDSIERLYAQADQAL